MLLWWWAVGGWLVGGDGWVGCWWWLLVVAVGWLLGGCWLAVGWLLVGQLVSIIYIYIYIYAGKSLTRGPLYGPSAARADGRRTKFDWREVRTMNSWSHLMQQHAAHGVRAQSSQLQTRPGLWPPAPEVKPKATSGVLSSCNRRGMPAVCKPHTDAKKAIACKSRPGQAPFEPRSGSKTIPGGWQGPTFLW